MQSSNMAPDKQLKLFELTGSKKECVFSPFVWRVRLAMLHKGLTYESISWYYTEKDRIKPAEKVSSTCAAC